MITKLELHRFKAIRKLSLPLRRLNLFAGVNGMGKSTCLQSMLLLRQSRLAGTLPDEGLLLRGPLADLGRGEDVLHQLAEEDTVVFSVETEKGSIAWNFRVEPSKGLIHEILPLDQSCDTYERSDGAYAESPFNSSFHYLSAERITPEVAYETSFYSVKELGNIGRRGEFAIHYLAEHRDRPLAIPELRHDALNERQCDLQTNVRAWLGEISPGISFNVDVHAPINRAALSYDYDIGPSNRFSHQLKPTNVGFGITYALPIIVAVLASTPESTLIVENPESHLHPRGQACVGRLLAIAAAGGVQVFVETHSDHVLNGIRIAVKDGLVAHSDVSIAWFDRPAGDAEHSAHVTEILVDKDGKIDSWPEGFFDEIEKQLFKLL